MVSQKQFPRLLALFFLAAVIAGCSQPGCGYWTSDADQMTKLKADMKSQGIEFEVMQDGMVRCSPKDSQRFREVLARRQSSERQEWQEAKAGTVSILTDKPQSAACLATELTLRQLPFSVGLVSGRQSVEWRPSSESQKQEIFAVATDCERRAELREPSNNRLEPQRHE